MNLPSQVDKACGHFRGREKVSSHPRQVRNCIKERLGGKGDFYSPHESDKDNENPYPQQKLDALIDKR